MEEMMIKGGLKKVRKPSQDVKEVEIECFLLAFFAFFLIPPDSYHASSCPHSRSFEL